MQPAHMSRIHAKALHPSAGLEWGNVYTLVPFGKPAQAAQVLAKIATPKILQEIGPVAHSITAKKRIRQNEKHRARNRARKQLIKDLGKSFGSALQSGDFGKAEGELNKLTQRLDRTAAKHTIHKNTPARKPSQLTPPHKTEA